MGRTIFRHDPSGGSGVESGNLSITNAPLDDSSAIFPVAVHNIALDAGA